MNAVELFEDSMDEKALTSRSIEEHVTYISAESGEYVLKTPDWDYKSVKAEPYIIRDLSNKTDIPLPEIYHISESPVFFIMEYLSGRPKQHATELDICDLCECANTIGKVLAEVQTVQRSDIGRLVYRDGSLKTRKIGGENSLSSVLNGLYKQAQLNFEFEMDIEKIQIPNSTDITYCPIDFNCTNFLFDEHSFSGVVDFERIYSGPAGWGYCNTLHCLSAGRNMDEKQDISEAFASGYGNVRDIPNLHPTYEILAILREMRAAHIWWDNPDERSKILLDMLKEKTREKP